MTLKYYLTKKKKVSVKTSVFKVFLGKILNPRLLLKAVSLLCE